MSRFIAFGEPRLDAQLASILAEAESNRKKARPASPRMQRRAIIFATLLLVGALALAQWLAKEELPPNRDETLRAASLSKRPATNMEVRISGVEHDDSFAAEIQSRQISKQADQNRRDTKRKARDRRHNHAMARRTGAPRGTERTVKPMAIQKQASQVAHERVASDFRGSEKEEVRPLFGGAVLNHRKGNKTRRGPHHLRHLH